MLRPRQSVRPRQRQQAQGTDVMLQQASVQQRLQGIQLINAKKLGNQYGNRTVAVNMTQRRLTNECRVALKQSGFNAKAPGACHDLTVALPDIERARAAKRQAIRKVTGAGGRARDIQAAISKNEGGKDKEEKKSLFRKIAAGELTQDDLQDVMLQYGDSAFTGSLRSMMNPYNFSRMFTGNRRDNNTASASAQSGVAATIVTSLALTGKQILVKLGLGFTYALLVSFVLSAYKRIRTLSPRLPQLGWLVELNDEMQQTVLDSVSLLTVGFAGGSEAVKRQIEATGNTAKPAAAGDPEQTKPPDIPGEFGKHYGNRDFNFDPNVHGRRSSQGLAALVTPSESQVQSLARYVIDTSKLTVSSTHEEILAAIQKADFEDLKARRARELGLTANEVTRLQVFSKNLRQSVYNAIMKALKPADEFDIEKLMSQIAANTQRSVSEATMRRRAVEHNENSSDDLIPPSANELAPVPEVSPSTAVALHNEQG